MYRTASIAKAAIDAYLAALSLALRRRCPRCRARAGAGWQAAIALCVECRDFVEEVGADLDAAAYDYTLAGSTRANAECIAVDELMAAESLAHLLIGAAAGTAAVPHLPGTGVLWMATAVLPVLAVVSLVGWAALVPLLAILAATAGSYALGPVGAVAGAAAVAAFSWCLVRAGDALMASAA